MAGGHSWCIGCRGSLEIVVRPLAYQGTMEASEIVVTDE
jgi:hypothetical protein